LDRGEKAISRKMVSNVLDEFSRIKPHSGAGAGAELLAKLSPRELDVLREMESEATNLQIAQRLFLSENTVKHHIRNILDKLEMENRREVILFARQSALRNKIPHDKSS